MSDITKFCYPTIQSIKEWQKRIEKYSGFECTHIRDLEEKATHQDYLEAKEKDGAWFEGFVHELSNLI